MTNPLWFETQDKQIINLSKYDEITISTFRHFEPKDGELDGELVCVKFMGRICVDIHTLAYSEDEKEFEEEVEDFKLQLGVRRFRD